MVFALVALLMSATASYGGGATAAPVPAAAATPNMLTNGQGPGNYLETTRSFFKGKGGPEGRF